MLDDLDRAVERLADHVESAERLALELRERYSIVIVTHNMQQAARVSDMTAFFTVALEDDGHRTGRMVEFDETQTIFTNPSDERTEAYVTGKVG